MATVGAEGHPLPVSADRDAARDLAARFAAGNWEGRRAIRGADVATVAGGDEIVGAGVADRDGHVAHVDVDVVVGVDEREQWLRRGEGNEAAIGRDRGIARAAAHERVGGFVEEVAVGDFLQRLRFQVEAEDAAGPEPAGRVGVVVVEEVTGPGLDRDVPAIGGKRREHGGVVALLEALEVGGDDVRAEPVEGRRRSGREHRQSGSDARRPEHEAERRPHPTLTTSVQVVRLPARSRARTRTLYLPGPE